MAGKLDIINIALSRINEGRIAALHEESKQARIAALVWDTALSAALRSHEWGFAGRREKLARLAAKPCAWQCAYAVPAEYIIIRRVLPPGVHAPDVPSEPFRIGNLDGRTAILCNLPDAEAEYTARVDNCELFDSQFTDALAWRLASDFALALKSDAELAGAAMQMAERAKDGAEGASAKEQGYVDDDVSSFEKARWA